MSISKSEQMLFSIFQIGITIQQLNKNSERNSGLSLVQWCLLKCLIDLPGTSAYSLAKSVGIHPSTLTQTLKRLERKKLIFITEDPLDSRKKLISITKFGKIALEQTYESLSKYVSKFSEHDEEFKKIKTLLQDQIAGKV